MIYLNLLMIIYKFNKKIMDIISIDRTSESQLTSKLNIRVPT